MEMLYYGKVKKWIDSNKLNCVECYILYIDILGYKSLIHKEDFFDNYSYIQEVIFKERLDEYKSNNSDCKKNVQYRVFSDNIIIAIPKDDGENELKSLCSIASRVQSMILFHFGYLIRGSISIGQLYLGANFVYGEGLIRAYELENLYAIHPRIILDDKSLEGEKYFIDSKNTILEIDVDYKIINYLHFYFEENLKRSPERIYQLKRMLCYIENLLSHEDEEVKKKGLYTANLFNTIIDKYKIGTYINKIKIEN